jgi:hypothetical protein
MGEVEGEKLGENILQSKMKIFITEKSGFARGLLGLLLTNDVLKDGGTRTVVL